jgi:hypothetical protein
MHEVRASTRGGLGLFATVDLACGTRIATLEGPTCSVRRFDALVDAGMCAYAGMLVGRRYVVDSGLATGGPPGTWYRMNHSLDGNVRPVRCGRAVAFETTRAVEAGEELLYAYDTWAPPGWVD